MSIIENTHLFKYGDRVIWRSCYNSKIKHGEYIGCVKHTYRWGGKQLALVQFDKNKHTSKVPIAELSLGMSPYLVSLFSEMTEKCRGLKKL